MKNKYWKDKKIKKKKKKQLVINEKLSKIVEEPWVLIFNSEEELII